MEEQKVRRSRSKLIAAVIVALAVIGLGFYSINSNLISNIIGPQKDVIIDIQVKEPEVQTLPTEPQPEAKPIIFTGRLIAEKDIDSEKEEIFPLMLAEKKRIAIEGSFEKPVTLLVLTEPYYSAWLQERIVKTNAAYAKDKDKFSIMVDINEGAGREYYFIIYSPDPIKGKLTVIDFADL